jgi:hypothetical protein
MNIFDAAYNLLEHLAGFLLVHPLLADDIVKELASFHVLHDEEEVFGRFDDFVELDDIGVADEFEDVDLSGHSFHVGHIDYPVFFQYFYGYFLAGGNVGGQFDLPEGALAQGLFWIGEIVQMR